MPPWKLLFTLYLTTFTAGSTVHYLKAARRDKNFSTLHGEIVKNDLLMPTLFIASLWYCIYTLQYSAKKQNVQLHKYKIRPLCLMVKHIQRVTLKCCDEFSKTKTKMSIKLKLAPLPVSTNRLVTSLLHSRQTKSKGMKNSNKIPSHI